MRSERCRAVSGRARVMYECVGLRLLYCEGLFLVLDGAGAVSFTGENPIEAWTHYHERVDMAVRRRIGVWCETHGRKRYTGEVAK